jgi:hypothetical protein
MRQSAPSLNIELQQKEEKPIKISRLINSIYYFIESVFIIAEKQGYRLVAIHQGKLLTDQTYKTVKGARIAFLKMWSYKAWKEGVKAKWSHFYPPDPKWLEKNIQVERK